MKLFLLGFVVLLASLNAAATYDTAWVRFNGPNWTYSNEILVPNMPKVRSQSSVGVCFAMVSATVLDHYRCQQENWDCPNITDKQRISPLELARYNVIIDASKENSSDKKTFRRLNPNSGDVTRVLDRASGLNSVANEECASFTRAATIYSDDELDKQRPAFFNLKNIYEEAKKKPDEVCLDCIQQIKRDFIIQDEAVIIKALQAETLEEFYYRLLIPAECERNRNQIAFPKDAKIMSWPFENTKVPFTNEQLKKQTLSLLQKKIPVIFDRICLQRIENPNLEICDKLHTVVVTGFRRMCKTEGDKQCYDAFKVQNSWGEAWQKEYNDGWVAADPLMDRMSKKLPPALIWIEQDSIRKKNS